MSTESELKKKLRADLRGRIHLISADWRQKYSAAACQLLRRQNVWQEAKSILFYSPLSTELDVLPLLTEARNLGKAIYLPRFNVQTQCYSVAEVLDFERDAVPGKFGILEPSDNCNVFNGKHLDFTLVPGVGFDTLGARLGRGRGFYDRLLAQISGSKCGIGFDEQIVPHIPTAPHDVKMNFVLTPTRWIDTAEQS